MQTVTLPGSKSIAARALILKRALGSTISLANLPNCDDTNELATALKIYDREPDNSEIINLGNGGTSLRFFLALAASTPGFKGVIDCGDQLRRRPIAPLIEALRSAGANITCLNNDMRPPLLVTGTKLSSQDINLDVSSSSQFASALILASPLWSKPYSLPPDTYATSRPYLDMSEKMLQIFSNFSDHTATYTIESDWSAAAFFYEYVRLNPGKTLRLPHLPPPDLSLQGDSAAARLFAMLDVDTTFNADGSATIRARHGSPRPDSSPLHIDMKDTPDLVPPLAVCACMCGIRFSMRGIKSLRFKESDRIATLCSELRKAGFILTATEDTLCWHGDTCAPSASGIFDSHNDHRIAMALAAAGVPPQRIKDPGCVSKSFPDFYNTISSIE